MKTKTIGIVVLALGIIMMIYTGVTFFTTENVAVIGDLEINKTNSHPVNWSPYVGLGLIVVGLLMVFIKRK